MPKMYLQHGDKWIEDWMRSAAQAQAPRMRPVPRVRPLGEEYDKAYSPAQGIFIGLGIGTLLWGVIIFIWWLL